MDRFRRMVALHVRPRAGRPLTLFVAERRRERLIGLAGLRSLPLGAGLLIPCCRSVHTFGMRFPLAVAFVTIDCGTVLVHDLHPLVRPCRVVRASAPARRRPALAAIELPHRYSC